VGRKGPILKKKKSCTDGGNNFFQVYRAVRFQGDDIILPWIVKLDISTLGTEGIVF
jgi:hypothetical protein